MILEKQAHINPWYRVGSVSKLFLLGSCVLTIIGCAPVVTRYEYVDVSGPMVSVIAEAAIDQDDHFGDSGPIPTKYVSSHGNLQVLFERKKKPDGTLDSGLTISVQAKDGTPMLIRPGEQVPQLRLTGQTCGNYDITSNYELNFRAYRSCMDRLQKKDTIIFEVSSQSGSYSTLEYAYTLKDMGYFWYIDAI